jgi:hypothetical protein
MKDDIDPRGNVGMDEGNKAGDGTEYGEETHSETMVYTKTSMGHSWPARSSGTVMAIG